MKYLGVLVNRDGFRPDSDKIEPVVNYPVPKNLKHLRRFMGMASWYRKFLADIATIAEPLTSLTKKDRRYEWGAAQQEAFEKVKALIASAPVLARPSFNAQLVVQTDASDMGISAVLLQAIGGQERVLEFASCTLSSAERNYRATERECLAVFWAIGKFRPYIEGYHFLVVTDHSSLQWLHSLHSPTGRLARWALELQGHSFDVEHRKGALNHVPDALSRMYEEEDLEVSEPRAHPRWKVVAGQLYFYAADETIDSAISDDDAWKLVVPCERRREVLRESHDDPTAGHGGREKTHERIARLYFWPNLYKSVRKFVQRCHVCQQTKADQRIMRRIQSSRPTPSRPRRRPRGSKKKASETAPREFSPQRTSA